MNIDGHKFNFPEKPLKSIPPLEKIYPTQNPPQDENEKNFPKKENEISSDEELTEDSSEQKRKEKNQIEDKGKNIDITI